MAKEKAQSTLALLEEYGEGKWLTPEEVAEAFHVNTKTVGRWRKEGRLVYRDGVGDFQKVRMFRTPGIHGHTRYNAEDIRTLLEQDEDD